MLTVMSWNMHQRFDAWEHLETLVTEHGVAGALLQEAKKPRGLPEGWESYPDSTDEKRWRITVPRYRMAGDEIKEIQRWYASAIIATGDRQIAPRVPTELNESMERRFACSHPGQFAVGDIELDNGRKVTFISLYGIWDRMEDSGDLYVDATLHRAISDLTIIFQERSAEYVLIGGDLNLYSYSDGTVWGERGMVALKRLQAYCLERIGPRRLPHEPRLERCPCPDLSCEHVNTFLYQSNPKSKPHQLDFFFATPALARHLTTCWADPDPDWFTHSDHRPIFATFDL